MKTNQSAIGTTNQTAESQTGIRIFENAQFGQIRTASGASNEPLFCLADVCKALDLGNPSQVKQRLQKAGVISNEVGVQTGMKSNGKPAIQIQQLNFITEPNLYRCIFQSRKKEAEQFQNWVCEEILPSIRRTGGYMTVQPDETPEQLLSRALLIANDALNRTKQHADVLERKTVLLQSQNEVQARRIGDQEDMLEAKDKHIQFLMPGARFANAVKTSDTSILVGDLARIIKQNGVETGQNRLFEWMRQGKFLIGRKGESHNLPTQRALEMGLFEIKKTTITKPDGTTLVTTTPKVTGKGQVYFVNRFLYEEANRQGAEFQKKLEADRKEGKL